MAKRGHNYHELSNGHGEAGSTHSQLHPLFAMRRAIQFTYFHFNICFYSILFGAHFNIDL